MQCLNILNDLIQDKYIENNIDNDNYQYIIVYLDTNGPYMWRSNTTEINNNNNNNNNGWKYWISQWRHITAKDNKGNIKSGNEMKSSKVTKKYPTTVEFQRLLWLLNHNKELQKLKEEVYIYK